MLANIPIYYINLPERPERQAWMEKQFSSLGISAERVSAVTPNDLNADEIDTYCNAERPPSFAPVELACSKSHLRAWEAFLMTDAEYAVILEDDAVLSKRFPAFLNEFQDLGVDIIRIESSERPHLTSPLLNITIAGIGFRSFRSTGWGTAGYAISRQAAQKLQHDPHLYDQPFDLTLFCPLEKPASSLKLLQADPALCVQMHLYEPLSGLETARSDIRGNFQLRAWTAKRLWREIRWGLIKLREKLTMPQMKRRLIPFSPD